ncbi:NADH-quinone oxidoreductase subunit C [Spirosoma sp. KUDC1026]|uniref:NADH-quinone oxidoreductase subunit C n=1 Tax=Spirosoma sp. KUDC1026 TaxID=2745947 RepID=UPI00159BE97A|nr:NADH-quinone oxidoreductase subunit C [Spirosoma sp. KUDC1026]QKZ12016.1 NADH-quinone oxidoreductase subunit C [Spirosoma sp. KUDC1026]
MTFTDIYSLLAKQFPQTLQANTQNLQPFILVPADQLVAVCQFLRDDDRLFFDLLACLTGLDNSPAADTMDVVYNLTSIPYEHDLMIRVTVPRNTGEKALPAIPSVAHIWRTADWHEREAFDLIGISFTGHPDLRRILLPTDWNGHPLRKDYKEDDQYHGIKTT